MWSPLRALLRSWHARRMHTIQRLLAPWIHGVIEEVSCVPAHVLAKMEARRVAPLYHGMQWGFPWDAWVGLGDEEPLPLAVQVFRRLEMLETGSVQSFIDRVPKGRRPTLLGQCLPFCQKRDSWEGLLAAGASLTLPDHPVARGALLALLLEHTGDWPDMEEFVRSGKIPAMLPVTVIGVQESRGEEGEGFAIPFVAQVLWSGTDQCLEALLDSGWNPALPVPTVVPACTPYILARQASAFQHLLLALLYTGLLRHSPFQWVQRLALLHARGCPFDSPGELPPPSVMAREALEGTRRFPMEAFSREEVHLFEKTLVMLQDKACLDALPGAVAQASQGRGRL
jgi:hypothetical protein